MKLWEKLERQIQKEELEKVISQPFQTHGEQDRACLGIGNKPYLVARVGPQRPSEGI